MGFFFFATTGLGETHPFFGYNSTASTFSFGGFNVLSFYYFGSSGFGWRGLRDHGLREKRAGNSIGGSGTGRRQSRRRYSRDSRRQQCSDDRFRLKI